MLVGYAEDVVPLTVARDVEFAQLKLSKMMRTVWITDHGLSLTLNKIDIVVLTKKRIPSILPMRVEKKDVYKRQHQDNFQENENSIWENLWS